MNPEAKFYPYQLEFIAPVLTSRGSMAVKNGYVLELTDNGKTGKGEVSFIEGLSIDRLNFLPELLNEIIRDFSSSNFIDPEKYSAFPSLRFALEMTLIDLKSGGNQLLFDTAFTNGNVNIPINGLVWMGDKVNMKKQIVGKVQQGFKCIKLKVGALDFDEEISLLQFIRTEFKYENLELRLDANGAFLVSTALEKLKRLSTFHIHSIEQPIRQGQTADMADLVEKSPIPIALDEDLIYWNPADKKKLLEIVKPDYVILKPSMLGGFDACDEWIGHATALNIGWWATSALETNIGLNAIAQWVSTKEVQLAQGLGTGALYKTNFPSPLTISNGELSYSPTVI